MKKKINKGVILTLVVLLCVSFVAYRHVDRLSKEKEAACAVVTEALKEYLNARTLPFEIRSLLKEGITPNSGELKMAINDKLLKYSNYLNSVMYAPYSETTDAYIVRMTRAAESNLNRQVSKFQPIDGYVLEELHDYRIGFLKDAFEINADFTEIVVAVEHRVIYNNTSTSTAANYSLIKVDGEWKINDVLNLYGVS
ncbi:MAG: hypothetical protein E7312_08870 [Clostridiales bacterium]|nr:hypothetical protein [Clostridiales bacterium]